MLFCLPCLLPCLWPFLWQFVLAIRPIFLSDFLPSISACHVCDGHLRPGGHYIPTLSSSCHRERSSAWKDGKEKENCKKNQKENFMKDCSRYCTQNWTYANMELRKRIPRSRWGELYPEKDSKLISYYSIGILSHHISLQLKSRLFRNKSCKLNCYYIGRTVETRGRYLDRK